MIWLLSDDPGIRGTACALWRNSVLVAAEYVRNTHTSGSGPRECAQMAYDVREWVVTVLGDAYSSVTSLALEWPQTYSGRASRGDTNDLFALAGVNAAVAALFPSAKVQYFVPHEWKGSVQKPKRAVDPYVIETRVRARLSPEENKAVQWTKNAKLNWDIADALGVGLKALGRFERGRVFPRE